VKLHGRTPLHLLSLVLVCAVSLGSDCSDSDDDVVTFPFTLPIEITAVDGPDCAQFDLAVNDLVEVGLTGGFVAAVDQGSTCDGVFIGAGSAQEPGAAPGDALEFDVAIDLPASFTDCADVADVTLADLNSSSYVVDLDFDSLPLGCLGAGTGGDISSEANPVPIALTCAATVGTCNITATGGLTALFDIAGTLALAPITNP